MPEAGTKSRPRALLAPLLESATARSLPHWTAAGLVGVAAVLYSRLFRTLEQVAIGAWVRHPWASLAAAPAAFGLATWLVVRFAPAARGSGIPQVMASIQSNLPPGDEKLDPVLGWRVGLVKVLSSSVCLLGGGAIGREGPTIHLAGVIFHFVGARSRRLFNSLTEQHWILTAGAAGLAAAFNTPLGGIVFALEELATFHFSRFRTVLFSSVIISGMMSQWMAGSYLYLGFPALRAVSTRAVLLAGVVGVVTGLLGAAFAAALLRGSRATRSWPLRRKLAFAAASGLAVSLLALLVDPAARGPGGETIHALLFGEDKAGSVALLAARFVSTTLSYLAGSAGGIFAPSLAIGALAGAKIAAWFGSQHPNLVILVGMTGFLSALTRAPFTALIVVLEMTDRHSAVFPLMVGSILASTVAGLFDPRSFYHHQSENFVINVSEGAI